MKKLFNNRQNSGITLIALVITIIVLLILAMVSISLVMNEGIITKSKTAVDKYSEEEIKEKIGIAYLEYQMSKYNGTPIQLKTALANADLNVADEDITGSDEEGYEITVKGKIYPLSATGTVGNAIEKWKQNADGSYSKGETSGVKVGDTVDYKTILEKTENVVDSTKLNGFKTDLSTYSGNSSSTDNSSINRDTLTWKVLDIKNGKIRLISSSPTTKKISLNGADGYNNAVYLIDKACDTLYSVNGIGTAQNLKIEDIEEKLSATGKSARDNYSNAYAIKYGETKGYATNRIFPNLYASEIGCKLIASEDNIGNTLGLSEQTELKEGVSGASSRLEATQTFWSKSMAKADFKDYVVNDSKYYNLFLNNGSSNYAGYFLASRCVNCCSTADFTVNWIGDRTIQCYLMYSSNGGSQGFTCAFRPVITLESNIQLSGDSTNGWTIQ